MFSLQSASMAFYDAELEREAFLQEQREREDQARDNLTRSTNANQTNVTSNVSQNPTEAYATPASTLPTDRRDMATPFTSLKRPPPTSTYMRAAPPSESARTHLPAPPSQFAHPTPISAMPGRADFDRGFLPPAPPSAFNLTTPLVTPMSALPGMGAMTAWNLSAHHTIHLPPRAVQPRQQDTVLIPSRGQGVSVVVCLTNFVIFRQIPDLLVLKYFISFSALRRFSISEWQTKPFVRFHSLRSDCFSACQFWILTILFFNKDFYSVCITGLTVGLSYP